MLNDRSKSMEIYKQANRLDKFEAEEHEYNIIKYLLAEVEKDLPKQMTEQEIIEKINLIVSGSGKPLNIGMIMAGFKELPADKALVSKLAKEFISTYAS